MRSGSATISWTDISYFPDAASATAAAQRARRELRGVVALAEPTISPVADTDWRESYKLHFKPWHFGRMHWVPVWERDSYALPAGDALVQLDPGNVRALPQQTGQAGRIDARLVGKARPPSGNDGPLQRI